ncbi:MAG: hypothetical protein ABI193_22235, partial [Minicystis sp.]
MSSEPPQGGAPPGSPGEPFETFDASARGTFSARGPSQSSPSFDEDLVPASARVPAPPSGPRPRSQVPSTRKTPLPGGTTTANIPGPAPLPRIPDMD